MILESMQARLNQLEFELANTRDRLAKIEAFVTAMRAESAVNAKTSTETKSASAPTNTTARSSR